MSFVGTFTNKLDAKGRVSIPAPFRQVLAEQGTQGVFCIPTVERNALESFGAALMAEFDEWLKGHSAIMDSDYDAKAQIVFGENQFLGFDDEGRVRLPDSLTLLAGITDRVTFNGLGRKFQIWDPERYESERRARLERAMVLRRGNGGAA